MRTRTTASIHFAVIAVMLLALFFTLSGPSVSHATIAPAAQDKLETYSGHPVAAQRVIVKYRSSKSRAALRSIAQTLDVDVDVELGGTGARLLHSTSRTVASLVAELSQRDDVLYAEPDYLAYGGSTPNDSFFASQQ